ncbi:hypothetical protein SAMN05192558_103251 [Actinokineospora alba]|uniref:ATP-grasp domain-containing protein n=1 Tax=Actinokineospora alba TaxID=504798 RepID=A0A1H0JWZ8_9PSEU|nr:peptide ligase PGM1-related protein [Actinokineospora alba]TDP68129.1 hypothetical protein C8E96_3691 [Actinokineospora alba]SDH92842.1 hypothetical protein SAMN05421871_102798 [Actinokineospora alba]SDO48206.1 hypothetical protein SAMN05192558_103251 [Actinokineospora alba]
MSRIILINLWADYPDTAEQPAVVPGLRLLWLAEAGDTVVVPCAVEDDFRQYLCDTLGLEPDSLRVLAWDGFLTDEAVVSEEFVSRLRTVLGDGVSWELVPCLATAGTAELAGLLDVAYPCRDFAAQRGPELLNRKSHFRRLAAGAGVPLPAGAVVSSPEALARAIPRLIERTGTVIIKQDNAGGGNGNIAVTTGTVGPLAGVREVRALGDDVDGLARSIWAETTYESSHVLTVESYHPAERMFYFEYLIGEDAIPVFLNSGTVQLAPKSDPEATSLAWVGLELPADVPAFTLASALTWSMRFAMAAAQLGYRGYINIDALQAETGELIFNESNARWGGGLALHAVGERLLGPRYADTHFVRNLRDVNPVPLNDLLKVLGDNDLLFSRQAHEGVVVLAADPALVEPAECLIIGPSQERNHALEAAFRDVVSGLSACG